MNFLEDAILTTTILQFTNRIFHRWLEINFVGMTFTYELADDYYSLEKLSSIISILFVISSVKYSSMDLHTE